MLFSPTRQLKSGLAERQVKCYGLSHSSLETANILQQVPSNFQGVYIYLLFSQLGALSFSSKRMLSSSAFYTLSSKS